MATTTVRMLLASCGRPSRDHASALCGKIYFLHFYILLTVFFRIARAIRACWNGLGFWGRLPFVSFAMTGLCYGAWLLVMKVEVFLKCNDPNCWSCANTPMCIQCNIYAERSGNKTLFRFPVFLYGTNGFAICYAGKDDSGTFGWSVISVLCVCI